MARKSRSKSKKGKPAIEEVTETVNVSDADVTFGADAEVLPEAPVTEEVAQPEEAPAEGVLAEEVGSSSPLVSEDLGDAAWTSTEPVAEEPVAADAPAVEPVAEAPVAEEPQPSEPEPTPIEEAPIVLPESTNTVPLGSAGDEVEELYFAEIQRKTDERIAAEVYATPEAAQARLNVKKKKQHEENLRKAGIEAIAAAKARLEKAEKDMRALG